MEKFVRILTTVFWVAAPLCVVLIAVSSFTESAGVLWATGVALLVVMLSSGGIAWVEFRGNSLTDTERGEWTNKMLFYALVFTITLFVAFLYLPTLFFAR